MTLIKSISGFRGTIGGRIGEGLTPFDLVNMTSAFAAWLPGRHRRQVVIGRDARVSGEMVSRIVSATLQACGIDVVDTGLATTPTVEMAVTYHRADGGIILTASHNPAEWNALKLLDERGEFVSADDLRAILRLSEKADFVFASITELGSYTTDPGALDRHIAKILALPLVNAAGIQARGFRVAVDAVNSVGGPAVKQLLGALGVTDATLLNGEPTGRFAHNPEPLTEHLQDLIRTVRDGNYDLGIAVDPDVDRLVLISNDGEPFNEEYTLVAVADYVLTHYKGSTVSNLSSTRALADVADRHGVGYYPAAVGEVNVVEKMKATNAVIGGEGNGGVICPALHYGRDALVGIALVLSYLVEADCSLSELRTRFPAYFMAKKKVAVPRLPDVGALAGVLALRFPEAVFDLTDGLKISYPDKRWVHVRASNTEPVVRLYAEAPTAAAAEAIAAEITQFLQPS